MIEIRDLRIGNWVESKGEFGVVDGIWNLPNEVYKKVSFKGENIFAELSFSKINPIPLTTERLEKCGFHSFGFSGWEITTEYGWSFRLTTTEKRHLYFEHYPETELEYLHQLQNLYYALTNSELEIKL